MDLVRRIYVCVFNAVGVSEFAGNSVAAMCACVSAFNGQATVFHHTRRLHTNAQL